MGASVLKSSVGKPQWGWILAAACLVWMPAMRVAAQLTPPGEAGPPQRAFVVPPRELTRPIARARQAIDEKKYEEAAAYLGEALALPGQDYLIFVDENSGTATSFRREAQRMLGSIPRRFRAAYELRYGIEARQMLASAIEAGDLGALNDISQRYYHTEAGYQATMLLGHFQLQRGESIAAAITFQRLWDEPEARVVFDPELSILLAVARVLSGQEPLAREVLERLARNSASTRVEFSGREVDLPAGRDPLDWLLELVGDSPLSTVPGLNEWIMFRGNPQRNAVGVDDFPVPYPVWQVPTVQSASAEQVIEKIYRDFIARDMNCIPALQPLAVGDTLLVRSGERVLGVDILSGRRDWVFPDDMLFDAPADEEQPGAALEHKYLNMLWLDSLKGQCSSDGLRLYAIDSQPQYGQPGNPRAVIQSQRAAGPASANILRAADISREGAYVWEIGGANGLDEPQLANTFFLGVPLALEDSLYCIAERDSEIQLLALEPATGQLLWHHQLASSEYIGRIAENYTRRFAGMTPSYSNGILVCPTSANSLVAIDLASRNFLWGYEYANSQLQARSRYYMLNRPTTDGWLDSSVTLAGNRVICGPVDSDVLMCLDLETGISCWKQAEKQTPVNQSSQEKKTADEPAAKEQQQSDPERMSFDRLIPRDGSNYIACVHQNQVMLVGKNHCRSIDLDSGDELWRLEMAEHGRPSGRGYYANGSYYLPTTEARLVKIDIPAGKVDDWIDTNTVLGNLICHQGYVISQGVHEVLLLPQLSSLQQQVEPVANAQPPAMGEQSLRVAQAQILALEGKSAEALKLLTGGPLPQGLVHRELLLDLLLVGLRDDFAATQPLADKYSELLKRYRTEEYTRSTLAGLIEQKEYDQGLQFIFGMLRESQTVRDWPQGGLATQLAQLVPRRVSRSRLNREGYEAWVRQQLQQIVSNAGRERRADVLQEIGEFAVQQLGSYRNDELLAFVRMLNFAGQQDSFRLEFASRLFADQQWLASQVLTYTLLDCENEEIQLQAEGLYAQLLAEDERWDQAIRSLKKVVDSAPEARVSGQQSASDLLNQLVQRAEAAGARSTADAGADPQWLRGPVEVKPSRLDRRRVVRTYDMIQSSVGGRGVPDYRYSLNPQQSQLVIESRDGNSVAEIPLLDPSLGRRYSSSQSALYHQLDSLLIVVLGSQISAVDLYQIEKGREALLWQIETSSENQTQPNNATRSTLSKDTNNPWKLDRYTFLEYPQRQIGGAVATKDRKAVSIMAAPNHRGVCYLEGTQLVCADLLSGLPLWKQTVPEPKSGQPGASLASDGLSVTWLDIESRKCKKFDLLDGALLDEFQLDKELGEWLLTVGNGVLLTTESEEQQSLQYVDFADREIRWTHDYAENSRACLLAENRICVVEPGSGRFEILDIATGAVICAADLELGEDPCDSLVVYPRGEQYLVGVRQQSSSTAISIENDGANYTTVRCVKYGMRTLFDGTLHLVEPDPAGDGPLARNVWKTPVRVKNFDLPDTQVAEVPLIVLGRVIQSRRGRSSANHLQLAAIDARTGQEAVLHTDSQYPYSMDLKADLSKNLLIVDCGIKSYELSFTADVRRPRPPAHFDDGRTIDDAMAEIFAQQEIAARKAMEQQQKQLEEQKRKLEEKQKQDQEDKKQKDEETPKKSPAEKKAKQDPDADRGR